MIHVFEYLEEKKGELWETIKWDYHKPSKLEDMLVEYELKCDFRLPTKGSLLIPDPSNDENNVEFYYEAPILKIPHFEPGILSEKWFTPALKREWETLPEFLTFKLSDNISLEVKKDIVDALEHSLEGFLYVYRPFKIIWSWGKTTN